MATHRYTFVGEVPAILVGLIQGENAELLPLDPDQVTPHGSTIVASLGDVVETDEEYNSALLEKAHKPAHKASKTPKPETTDTTSEGEDK